MGFFCFLEFICKILVFRGYTHSTPEPYDSFAQGDCSLEDLLCGNYTRLTLTVLLSTLMTTVFIGVFPEIVFIGDCHPERTK